MTNEEVKDDIIKSFNEATYYIYLFEERAGIIEFDGGYSRQDAEKLARLEIRKLKNPHLYK